MCEGETLTLVKITTYKSQCDVLVGIEIDSYTRLTLTPTEATDTETIKEQQHEQQ